MNKGLFVHFIVTVIYTLCAMYIIGEEEIEIQGRAMLVICGAVINGIAALIMYDFDDEGNTYKKKIK